MFASIRKYKVKRGMVGELARPTAVVPFTALAPRQEPVRSRPALDFGPTAWKVRNGSIAGIRQLRGREPADRQRRKAFPSKGRMTGTRAVSQRRYRCGGRVARLSPGKRPSS